MASPPSSPVHSSIERRIDGSFNRGMRRRNNSENDLAAVPTLLLDQYHKLKCELRAARRNVGLFRTPILTLQITFQLITEAITFAIRYLLSHHVLLYLIVSTSILASGLFFIPGAHQHYVQAVVSGLLFLIWWVGLGVLSSIGLGTGLHTFVLYLGPYLAKVTLFLSDCGTLAAPIDGPHAFQCPIPGSDTPIIPVTFWGIFLTGVPAAFLWGAGTAIGELPPYFVARSAAQTGAKLAELDELDVKSPTTMDRVKKQVFIMLQKYGWIAIALFASVPNPLFDLAGLTCGHFMVPFWTFFTATLVGKAVIKAHLQAAAVILAFDANRLDHLIAWVESTIPFARGKLKPFFDSQRKAFHPSNTDTSVGKQSESGSMLGFIWNIFLGTMILWFVKSLIESKVQERVAQQDQVVLKRFVEEHGLHQWINKEEVNDVDKDDLDLEEKGKSDLKSIREEDK